MSILLNPNLNYDIVQYTDIIPGRVQALELILNEKTVTILNIYGPNNDDLTVFNDLLTYLNANNEKSFIIGGDFNTVININLDKKNGRHDTHKKCRQKINTIIELHDLVDTWRIHNPDKLQFTWHSNTKLSIYSRLDYFLISDNLLNYVLKSNIKPGYKSDHSIVELNFDFIQQKRGPGYFKLNNSLLLEPNYQNNIRKCINDIVNINSNANTNTIWEIIKGSIRNETIKYSANKKKKQNELEQKLINDFENIENQIEQTTNASLQDELTKKLDNTRKLLNDIMDIKLNGIIIRSKSQFVEHHEKNTGYFSNLEKKQSEKKCIKTLKHNERTVTNINDIME